MYSDMLMWWLCDDYVRLTYACSLTQHSNYKYRIYLVLSIQLVLFCSRTTHCAFGAGELVTMMIIWENIFRHAYTMLIQCLYNAYAMIMQCLCNAYAMIMQRLYDDYVTLTYACSPTGTQIPQAQQKSPLYHNVIKYSNSTL